MDNSLYDVYFRGGITPDKTLATVKANLATLFNASDEKIEAMFSGRAIVIKKNLPEDSALKYQAILEKAGAKVILRQQPAATTSKAAPTEKTPEKAPKKALEKAPEKTRSKGFDLAPVGSDVLTDSEKSPFVELDIDTSRIKLASAFAQSENDSPTPPPPPNTDHISVADVGADILEEKPPTPKTPNIDLSDINIEPL